MFWTTIPSWLIALVIFTIIGLIPYVGSYVSYGHDAQEFKSYMNADSIIVDYAYENNIEKERLSGEDNSRIKNTLIMNYLSYGQRYRIHINDQKINTVFVKCDKRNRFCRAFLLSNLS